MSRPCLLRVEVEGVENRNPEQFSTPCRPKTVGVNHRLWGGRAREDDTSPMQLAAHGQKTEAQNPRTPGSLAQKDAKRNCLFLCVDCLESILCGLPTQFSSETSCKARLALCVSSLRRIGATLVGLRTNE